jgi:hypothetical protein
VIRIAKLCIEVMHDICAHPLWDHVAFDLEGSFAAWEQPQLFAEEVRAGLRPLRA